MKQDTKKHVQNYVEQLKTINNAIKQYQDQKRDVKKNFKDNGWLTQTQQRLIDKALTMIAQDVDSEELNDVCEGVKRILGLAEEKVENNSSSEESSQADE